MSTIIRTARTVALTTLGKTARFAARLRGGNGSALPGLIVERIDRNFMRRTLERLPHGVVVVSGTNGKTTTTKMVVELLRAQGLRVFTNPTGSNFTRGVASALLGEVNLVGRLNADIAVLELDEAHAVHFVRTVPPTHCLLLNVMRDQLDRFGEIDNTAALLRTIAQHTTQTVVLNREDPRVAAIATQVKPEQVKFFGLSAELSKLFINDDELHETPGAAPTASRHEPADVVLLELDGNTAAFDIDGDLRTVQLGLDGVYNVYNAAAALVLARAVLGEAGIPDRLLQALSQVAPAFGRGEKLTVAGQPFELVLVKNPGGFRLALQSFDASGVATMIAINDNYADGRDMSWLWDVDFSSLAAGGVSMVSGVRAFDMALRLHYDEVPIAAVEPTIQDALDVFIAAHPAQPKRVFCTYTAMLALRKELASLTRVEVID